MGETAHLSDGKAITLVGVDRTGDILKVTVQVSNLGTRETQIRSVPNWAVQSVQGDRFDTRFSMDNLNATLPPGDKVKGTIEFAVPRAASALKLYYKMDSDQEEAAIFTLDPAAAAEPFPKPDGVDNPKPYASGAIYKVGDAVTSRGVIAKLVSADLEGPTRLRAGLVVYNGAAKGVHIQDSDRGVWARTAEGIQGKRVKFGWPLWFNMIPGDALRGDFTWDFPAPAAGIKVYFTDDLQDGATYIWAVDQEP